jgi:hypothetical protein
MLLAARHATLNMSLPGFDPAAMLDRAFGAAVELV